MAKGIDSKFVHYGIRRDDLSMIEAISLLMPINCCPEGIIHV